MKVGELFIALGFQVDNAKLKEFNDKLEAGQKSLAKVGAGAAAAVYGINRFLNSSVKGAESLRNYREQTGYATEELYKFFRVAERVNTDVTLDNVISTYSNLASAIGNATRGILPEGALWNELGNAIYGSNPDEIINKIREKMPSLLARYESKGGGGRKRLVDDLEEMGISADIAQALMASQSQWDTFRNLPTPTEQQLEAMERMAQTYKEFSQNYEMFKWRMSERIAPHFQNFVEFVSTKAVPVLEEFTLKLAEQIQPKLQEFAQNMGTVFSAMYETLQGSGIKIDESTGLIGALVLLYAKLNPLRWVIVGTIVALNELGKIMKGEDSWLSSLNWEDQKDSWAALLAKVPALKDTDFVKNRLKSMGLSPEDFGPDFLQSGVTALNESAARTSGQREMEARRAAKGYPPQPYPIAPIEQNNTINTTINTAANMRDTADQVSILTQAQMRNLSLDMLMGAQGIQIGSPMGPPSVLRTQ